MPEIAIIAGTRAAFGAGLGLLLAEYMNRDQRRAVGWTLLAVGAVSTVPIALQLFGGKADRPGGTRGEARRIAAGWTAGSAPRMG